MPKPADRDNLIFRQDYFDDPAGWQAITALLGDIFGVDISALDRFGGHDRSNLASAFFDAEGICIANLSAFSMPLMIDGRIVSAGAWQSGAVRPAYRGQGLFRDLIHIALERCETAGFEVLVLYTDKPGLYAPYGFVAVSQFSFVGPPPAAVKKPATVRRLVMNDGDDLSLMQALLAGRAPISRQFAVADQAKMFLLNTVLIDGVSVDYLEDEQVAIAWRQTEDGTFDLLDVVGKIIPALAKILAALDQQAPRIHVHFPTDRLDWSGEPLRDEGPLVLMMRCAPRLIPDTPFCLSPLAEF
jgi:GNAT superfamily N-acetyltransferase